MKMKLTAMFLILSSITIAAEIQYGENIQDSVGCRQTDTWTFDASIGDQVVIHVVELSDFGGVCGHACLCFDQLVELQAEDGTVLANSSSPTSHNNGGRFRTQIGPELIQTNETYSVSIRDKQDDGRGEYRIFVQNVNNPSQSTMIQSGDIRLDNVNLGEVDTYQFEGHTGQRARIEMSAVDNIKPRLALYDPAGQTIVLPDNGTIDVILDDDGFFTLLAFSEVAESGSYQLTLEIEPCQSNTDCLHLPCTTATCVNGTCEETIIEGFCLINELCYDDQEVNPNNDCEECDEAASTGWTPAVTGTLCGDQTSNECTDPDTCENSVCLSNDSSCDDEDVCTGTETCDPDLGCVAGTSLDCNDAKICTTDTCDPVTGCSNTNNTVSCDDANACTGNDTCNEGTCSGQTINCDDGNLCTTDTCNTNDGCDHTPIICADDGSPCTDQFCDATDGCLAIPNDDNSCDDDNVCNGAEFCEDGTCVDGTSIVCDDDNPCTDNTCDPTDGCVFALDNANSCDDDDFCNGTETCVDGICENLPRCGSNEACDEITFVCFVPCVADDECLPEQICSSQRCAFSPPNPSPDEDLDGVLDPDDDCPDTAVNVVVDEFGCEIEPQDTPNVCGTCGTVGMISWSMIFLGFVGMKRL